MLYSRFWEELEILRNQARHCSSWPQQGCIDLWRAEHNASKTITADLGQRKPSSSAFADLCG